MTVLFSIPAHESPLVVKDTVDNITKYVKDSVVVIHAARQFEDFDSNVFKGYDNVIINPMRFATALHHSQLHLHLTNLVTAFNEDVRFDYFTVFHTNQMFVKYGFEDYIKQYQYSAWTDFNTFKREASLSDYAMHKKRMDDFFGRNTYKDISALLAEGSFYSKEIISEIAEVCRHTKTFEQMNVPSNIEETIPVTLALNMTNQQGYGRPTAAWLGNTPITTSLIDDVINNKPITQEYVDHQNNNTKTITSDCLYSIKRIPRDINNQLRTYINGLA